MQEDDDEEPDHGSDENKDKGGEQDMQNEFTVGPEW